MADRSLTFGPGAGVFAKTLVLLLALCAPAAAADGLPAGRAAKLPLLAACTLPVPAAPKPLAKQDPETASDDDDDDDSSDSGPTYFRYPGSDTCIAVGGELEYDAGFTRPVLNVLPGIGNQVIPRFALDSVTATDYGVLRAFLRVSVTQRGPNSSLTPNSPASLDLEYAFVSLGDVETGRSQAGFTDSTFNFYNNALNVLALRGPGASATLLRYSRLPSSGFGFAASLEGDALNVRQLQLGESYPPVLSQVLNTSLPSRLPLVNGSLTYSGGWGKAFVAGSVGQLQLNAPGTPSLPRFAALAGLEFDLTGGVVDGDTIWLQAAASSANVTYLGFGNQVATGQALASLADGVVSRAGPAKATQGVALTAAYSHSLSDAWTLNGFGSWASIRPAVPSGVTPFLVPFKETRIGANVVWAPVDKLSMTAEAMFINLQTSASTSNIVNVNSGSRHVNGLALAFQVKRDF